MTEVKTNYNLNWSYKKTVHLYIIYILNVMFLVSSFIATTKIDYNDYTMVDCNISNTGRLTVINKKMNKKNLVVSPGAIVEPKEAVAITEKGFTVKAPVRGYLKVVENDENIISSIYIQNQNVVALEMYMNEQEFKSLNAKREIDIVKKNKIETNKKIVKMEIKKLKTGLIKIEMFVVLYDSKSSEKKVDNIVSIRWINKKMKFIDVLFGNKV